MKLYKYVSSHEDTAKIRNVFVHTKLFSNNLEKRVAF